MRGGQLQGVRQHGAAQPPAPGVGALALIVSTVATMAVTVLVFDWANRTFGKGEVAP